MKKAWRIIISIVLIVALLGGVLIGVGIITGSDTERILSVLDARYNFSTKLSQWLDYFSQVWSIVWTTYTGAPAEGDALVMSAG